MKLYIANCSKQEFEFQYRVPETGKLIMQPIRAGHQIVVYKDDAPLSCIEAILDQHTVYGLVSAKDVKRTEAYIGLCYSIDKPVDIEAVMTAAEHNDEVLEKRGQDIRNATLGAIDQQLRTDAQERGGEVSDVAIEIDEVKQPGQNGPGFSQTLVTPGSTRAPGKKNRR